MSQVIYSHETALFLHDLTDQDPISYMVTVPTGYNSICDCLRSRNRLDIAVISDAMNRYVKRKDKNLNKLMKIAEVFRVTKPLRSYLEVLL